MAAPFNMPDEYAKGLLAAGQQLAQGLAVASIAQIQLDHL